MQQPLEAQASKTNPIQADGPQPSAPLSLHSVSRVNTTTSQIGPLHPGHFHLRSARSSCLAIRQIGIVIQPAGRNLHTASQVNNINNQIGPSTNASRQHSSPISQGPRADNIGQPDRNCIQATFIFDQPGPHVWQPGNQPASRNLHSASQATITTHQLNICVQAARSSHLPAGRNVHSASQATIITHQLPVFSLNP